jgi:hypothetical protein
MEKRSTISQILRQDYGAQKKGLSNFFYSNYDKMGNNRVR